MRWIDPIRRPGARPGPAPGAARGACVAAWLVAAALAGGRAEASPRGPIVLWDQAMDGVTAGQLHMELELAATADGPSAMTSTSGSVVTGRTTAARVELDPTAPAEAGVRLLGVSQVDVGIAAGRAEAAGAQDANCSAKVGITGADYTVTSQTQTFTAITATCSCTALAVGFLAH